jgi:excisionase family DNA binding protein
MAAASKSIPFVVSPQPFPTLEPITRPELTALLSLGGRLHQVEEQVAEAEHYIDAAEAANFLSINRRTLLKMARDGIVPAHPLGNGPRRLWRFLLSELDCWMRNRVSSPCRPCSPNRGEIQ